MKCPNCGKNVRSKNQCAHCGHVFNKNELKEAKNDDYTYVEETRPKRSSGIGSLVWGLVKLVIGVAILFLLFLFGPRIFNSVVEYFQPTSSEVVQNNNETAPEGNDDNSNQQAHQITQESSSTETGSSQNQATESSENPSSSEMTNESSQETSQEGNEETSEETTQEAGITLANSNVNLDEYPLISVEMEFDELDNNVQGEDFNFEVATNGNTAPLNQDFSLIKEGNRLLLSYNDPAINILSTETIEQTLRISSDKYNIDETISYDLPASNMDTGVAEDINNIINNNLADIANVSAAVYAPNSEIPYVYENQSTEAGALVGWFVIANTYNQVAEGQYTLDEIIPMNPDLIGENDQGTIATAETGTEYTVQDYVLEIIYNRDVSAMNHLIDRAGGPNAFNLWLNETGFFATRITRLLGLDEEYHIQGAVTSAQDVANIMLDLANLELNGQELDEIFLANLLDSPLTEKFPYNVYNHRRFEISSGDDNLNDQHYSGIVSTEDGNYIIVILANEFDNPQEVVNGVSQSIEDILDLAINGQAPETEESTETSEENSETTENQVEIIENTETVGNTGPFEDWQLYTSESGLVYGPDSDGDGFRDTYRNAAGEFVPIEWYQGADGLWYFNEIN